MGFNKNQLSKLSSVLLNSPGAWHNMIHKIGIYEEALLLPYVSKGTKKIKGSGHHGLSLSYEKNKFYISRYKGEGCFVMF